MQSAGFKEWAIICDAIERGTQSIILRKGGIAEGREGFAFRHTEFFLFPTWFHEQAEKVRGHGHEISPRADGEIQIRLLAKVEFASVVTSWETAMALEPFHIWTREVVRERFDYDDATGIHLAFIRAFRLSPPWTIPSLPAYRGCRSWVMLPPFAAAISRSPILSDTEHEARARRLRSRLAAGGADPGRQAT